MWFYLKVVVAKYQRLWPYKRHWRHFCIALGNSVSEANWFLFGDSALFFFHFHLLTCYVWNTSTYSAISIQPLSRHVSTFSPVKAAAKKTVRLLNHSKLANNRFLSIAPFCEIHARIERLSLLYTKKKKKKRNEYENKNFKEIVPRVPRH